MNLQNLFLRYRFLFPKINSCRGQGLIEFVMVITTFLMLTLGSMQWIAIANARSHLNVAAYAMCREYAVSQSKTKAIAAASPYLVPLVASSESGVPYPSWDVGDDDVTVNLTLYFKLFPIPIVRELFTNSQNWIEKSTGYYPIKSSCVMIKEETG